MKYIKANSILPISLIENCEITFKAGIFIYHLGMRIEKVGENWVGISGRLKKEIKKSEIGRAHG